MSFQKYTRSKLFEVQKDRVMVAGDPLGPGQEVGKVYNAHKVYDFDL